MNDVLYVAQILAELVVFIGPLALVVFYLRTKLGMEGRENPFGAPPRPTSMWFTPKVIVSAWVVAVCLMLALRWRNP